MNTLEFNIEIFKLELNIANINPITYWLKLALGIVLSIISFLWWLQILLSVVVKYNSFPANAFLNNMLLGLEGGNAGFIATAIFGFLVLYLLWCTQKGNIKFGIRIPFIFSLHLMKYLSIE